MATVKPVACAPKNIMATEMDMMYSWLPFSNAPVYLGRVSTHIGAKIDCDRPEIFVDEVF